MTIKEAKKRIQELEEENEQLKNRIEELEARGVVGRKKHDANWTRRYEDFVTKYESGMSIMEIVEAAGISRRTAYRYKEHYDGLKN